MTATARGSARTSRKVLLDVIAIVVAPFYFARQLPEGYSFAALCVQTALHGVAPGFVLERELAAAVDLNGLTVHKI